MKFIYMILKIYDSPGLGESREKNEKTKTEIFNLIYFKKKW